MVRSGKNARVFPPLRIRQESRYLFLDFIFILFFHSSCVRFFKIISYFLVIWLCEPAGCFFLLLLSRGIYTTHRGAVDVDILLLHLVLFFLHSKACSSLQTYLTFLLMPSCLFFFGISSPRSSGSDLAIGRRSRCSYLRICAHPCNTKWNDG